MQGRQVCFPPTSYLHLPSPPEHHAGEPERSLSRGRGCSSQGLCNSPRTQRTCLKHHMLAPCRWVYPCVTCTQEHTQHLPCDSSWGLITKVNNHHHKKSPVKMILSSDSPKRAMGVRESLLIQKSCCPLWGGSQPKTQSSD